MRMPSAFRSYAFAPERKAAIDAALAALAAASPPSTFKARATRHSGRHESRRRGGSARRSAKSRQKKRSLSTGCAHSPIATSARDSPPSPPPSHVDARTPDDDDVELPNRRSYRRPRHSVVIEALLNTVRRLTTTQHLATPTSVDENVSGRQKSRRKIIDFQRDLKRRFSSALERLQQRLSSGYTTDDAIDVQQASIAERLDACWPTPPCATIAAAFRRLRISRTTIGIDAGGHVAMRLAAAAAIAVVLAAAARGDGDRLKRARFFAFRPIGGRCASPFMTAMLDAHGYEQLVLNENLALLLDDEPIEEPKDALVCQRFDFSPDEEIIFI